MSGLVPGHSGLIAPPNLATNGGFFINQRNRVTTTVKSAHPAIQMGDYLADCWYANNNSIDYVAGATRRDGSSDVGHLLLSGYGKKGQLIDIVSRDTERLAILEDASISCPVTAAVNVYNVSGVPVKVWTRPAQRTGMETTLYSKLPVIKQGMRDTAVEVRKHIVDEWGANAQNVKGLIRIYLEQDGEFYVAISNYRVLAGAFKNPPKYAPVPYADDLARCQRYYQSGVFDLFAQGADGGDTFTYIGAKQSFHTKMAAVPTVVVTATNISEVGSTANVMANYTHIGGADEDGITVVFRKTTAGAVPRSVNANWTAEVV